MVFYIERIKQEIFISKCTAHQFSQAYCTVFSIYSTRLLIFIKVNFSFNFMLEVPSNATFNFKSKGPVSSANLSELEWISSKLLRANTGKEKALDTISASQACCMCCQVASCAEHTGSDCKCRERGEAGKTSSELILWRIWSLLLFKVSLWSIPGAAVLGFALIIAHKQSHVCYKKLVTYSFFLLPCRVIN